MASSFAYKSWGRTRGPKSLIQTQGVEIDVVAVTDLDSANPQYDGYSTENQRYLHVLLIDKNNSTNLTVTVYGYNHAFDRDWET